MSIQALDRAYARTFRTLGDPDSQSQYLLSLALGREDGGKGTRSPDRRVKGCKTALWAAAWAEDAAVRFQADSDSLLVGGVLAVFQALYDGAPAAEVPAAPPEFLEEVSREVIYPEVRENGLRECWRRVRQAAETADRPPRGGKIR